MDARGARERLREIEDELPGLLRAAYPDWDITDTGEGFRAAQCAWPGHPCGARPRGLRPQTVAAASMAEMWALVDDHDAVLRTTPAQPPGPRAGVINGGWAGLW